jgi:hypothetical protein
MAIVNDVVLIYLEDAPVSFARVENIGPDVKKDWYHIKLLMLTIPLQVVTWLLKDEYIKGHEFHMNGKKMRIEKVESPMEDLPSSKPASPTDNRKAGKIEPDKKAPKNIISFADLKKNHEPESG